MESRHDQSIRVSNTESMDTDYNRDSFEKLEEEIIGIHDYYMPDDYAGDNIA